MRRIRFFTIVAAAFAALTALAATPTPLTVAQTPAADHEQHHPGTPDADLTAAADPCAAGAATPAAAMPQAGMTTGTPAMGMGEMTGMMGQFDLMFLDMMAPHHASAVTMAQAALSRAERPDVRALAEEIIASQSAEIEQMASWRAQWFPDAPAMPMMPMEQMMEMMGAMMPAGMMGTPGVMPEPGGMGMMDMGQELTQLCATTEGFDLAFIDAMILHHQRAIVMAQVALERAERPELTALAQGIIDAQQREIARMQAWRAAWSAAATPTG